MRHLALLMPLLAAACVGPEPGIVGALRHPLTELPPKPGLPTILGDTAWGADFDTWCAAKPDILGSSPFMPEGEVFAHDSVDVGGVTVRRTRYDGGDLHKITLKVKSTVDLGLSTLRDHVARRVQSKVSLSMLFRRDDDSFRLGSVVIESRCAAGVTPDAWGRGPMWRFGEVVIERYERNGDCRWVFDTEAHGQTTVPPRTAPERFASYAQLLAAGEFEHAASAFRETDSAPEGPFKMTVYLVTVQEREQFIAAMRKVFPREIYVGGYRVYENDERAIGMHLMAEWPSAQAFSPPRSNSTFADLAEQRGVERWR